MIATASMVKAIAERAVPERLIAAEFFDSLERSVATYGLHLTPALTLVTTEDGTHMEPRSFFGHVFHIALRIESERGEPELGQTWVTSALKRCWDLDLLPTLVAESVIAFNMNAQRAHDHPLTWTEACLALGLRREG